jgi:hypothetical protein
MMSTVLGGWAFQIKAARLTTQKRFIGTWLVEAHIDSMSLNNL